MLYLPPPTMVFNSTDLEDLINQLPPPFVITGDYFNSHNTLWGCNKLDRRGKLVEDILTKRNLCILNGISPTYIHPATGSQSAICSPDIFLDMQWSTVDDMCGCDHYLITIRFGDRDASHANASWKLRKADWVSFADRASEQLGSGNPNISIDEFTEKN